MVLLGGVVEIMLYAVNIVRQRILGGHFWVKGTYMSTKYRNGLLKIEALIT